MINASDASILNLHVTNQSVSSAVIQEATIGTANINTADIDTALIGNVISNDVSSTSIYSLYGSIVSLIVDNLSSGTLYSTYASIGSAVITNATVNSLHTTIDNISVPRYYTGGNLTVKHDYTIKTDNEGRLGTNDLTIVYEPLSQRNLLDYASFLGISLDAVCTLLGLDPNNEFIQNYTVLSLEY